MRGRPLARRPVVAVLIANAEAAFVGTESSDPEGKPVPCGGAKEPDGAEKEPDEKGWAPGAPLVGMPDDAWRRTLAMSIGIEDIEGGIPDKDPVIDLLAEPVGFLFVPEAKPLPNPLWAAKPLPDPPGPSLWAANPALPTAVTDGNALPNPPLGPAILRQESKILLVVQIEQNLNQQSSQDWKKIVQKHCWPKQQEQESQMISWCWWRCWRIEEMLRTKEELMKMLVDDDWKTDFIVYLYVDDSVQK